MYLYLIRHGIAVDLDTVSTDLVISDESRPLTKEGRNKLKQVADRFQISGLKFDLIITSPLVRARQTTDMLIERELSSQVEVSPNLAPNGNLPAWLTEWNNGLRQRVDANLDISRLALVGHEPNLSQWAELLIFGKIYNRLVLKKCGIIGLKFPERNLEIGTAQLHCLIPPKYLV
jgi:phosphohistidine phosphatase